MVNKFSEGGSFMTDRIHVTALIQAEEGKDLELVKKELQLLCEKTRLENDCYRFDCFQDNNDPAHFILHEEFKNKAALDFHFTLPHTKHYLAQNLTKVVRAYFTKII